MIKIIVTFILASLIALMEVSFIWSLPFPANLISIIVPILIFYIVFGKTNLHWVFIVTAGIILDIFSFTPIGFYVVLFIGAYYIGRWIYYNYFASPSFISVMLLSAILITLLKSAEYFTDTIIRDGLYGILNFEELRVFVLALIINVIFMAGFYWFFRVFVRIFKLKFFPYERI